MARTLEAFMIAELGQLRYMVLVQQAQLEDCREKLAKAEGQVTALQTEVSRQKSQTWTKKRITKAVPHVRK